MKDLLLPNDNITNKISYYLVLFLLLSLPFDRFYSHLILACLIIHTLINLTKNSIKPVFTLNNLVLQSVFFITLLGIIYTPNKQQAYAETGRQITILLLPVIFCLNPLDLKKYRNPLLLLFALACTASIVYLYLQAFITIRYYHLSGHAIFSGAFTNHNFSEPFNIHATYFALLITIALVYLLIVLIKEKSTLKKILLSVCCLLLTAGIIQLGSKSVLLALLITVNFAIPYFLFEGRRRIRFMFFVIPFSLLVMVGIFKIDSLKVRYVTALKNDLSKGSMEELSDPRLARWEVALKLAAESPVIGHGSGSEKELLKSRFYENKYYRSYLSSLNAHNQFISFLIKSGIVGVLVYMITLFYGFRLAFRRRDLMLFTFMALITLISMSENIMDVDKGILFYSLFFSLFCFFDLKKPHKGI